MTLTRRGLFALAASAAAARKLPVMVPPMYPNMALAAHGIHVGDTWSNRLSKPFVLTRESLQAVRDRVACMPTDPDVLTWYLDG